jgi:hypothetical protein
MRYFFIGLDCNADEVKGLFDAENDDKASALLKKRGVFPTTLREANPGELTDKELRFIDEIDIAQVDSSGASPDGLLFPPGSLPCELIDGSNMLAGSFNMIGENGKSFFLFEVNDYGKWKNYLKIETNKLKKVYQSGFWLWKKTIVELADATKYELKGNSDTVFYLLDFEKFVQEEMQAEACSL